jgi:hypothetical protein
MMLNEDYSEMLRCFADANVEFLLVGAFAMAAHGHVRATIDMDVWVAPSTENAGRVLRALRQFGAPLHDLSAEDLQRDDTVFQIGVAPRRIDILTGLTGLRFDEACKRAVTADLGDTRVRVPCLADLIRNKRATGRPRDLLDAELLESLRDTETRDAD